MITNNKNQRLSNIEFLRILAMAFIVFGHIQGIFFDYNMTTSTEKILSDISGVGVCSVDLYILITGFFLITKTDINFYRFIKIFVETVFYSFVITLLFFFFHKASFYDCLSSLYPLAPTRFNYWFVSKYLGLILLQPFLSRFALSLTKRQYQGLLCVILLLTSNLTLIFPLGGLYCTGWSLWWFISLFFVGGYLRLYYCNQSHNFRILVIKMIIMSILLILCQKINYVDCSYNSLITLFTAVSIFCVFFQIQIKHDRIIRFLSPNIFAVYLIHAHFYIISFFKFIKGFNSFDISKYLFFSFIFTLFIFFIAVMIDKVVKWIEKIIKLNYFESKISELILTYIKKRFDFTYRT